MLRTVLVAGAVATALPAGATCAWAADGGFDSPTPPQVKVKTGCEHQVTPTCLVDLQTSRPGSNVSRAEHAVAPAGPAAPPTCHYEPDFTYNTSAAVQADGGPSQMAVAREVCPQADDQVVGMPLSFNPVVPPVPGVNIRALVDQASKALIIPLPKVALSPDADATQYVGLPLWAWSPAAAWVAKSVTVSAGGVSLTMTATPVFSAWSMGDGGSMTCQGPGTPYPSAASGRSPRRSPDCGWTYSRASVSVPGGLFPVSVTTHWKVVWSTTTGLSGSEPDLASSSSLRLRVSEIQALVTDVRP